MITGKGPNEKKVEDNSLLIARAKALGLPVPKRY